MVEAVDEGLLLAEGDGEVGGNAVELLKEGVVHVGVVRAVPLVLPLDFEVPMQKVGELIELSARCTRRDASGQSAGGRGWRTRSLRA